MEKCAGVFAFVLVMGLVAPSEAHSPPGELYFAVQFPDNAVPTIDGNISEWDIVPPTPYTITNNRLFASDANVNVAGRGEIDPGDMNIRHLIGWNNSDNKLYFMTEVFDNVHNTDRTNPSQFWQDDALEVEINPDATPTTEQNLEGQPINNISYKFAVPPVDGQYQFLRPLTNLPWLVDGSQWLDFGWSYEGEEFGESTYYYELAITPILSMPRDEATALSGLEAFDLEENGIIHVTVNVGDFDEPCSECGCASYQGFWSMSAEPGCCSGNADLVLAELDPQLVAAVGTAVEEVSWGQIKAGSVE
ncbi:MAG: hypothetical protein HYW07_12795 [Candidatus Latescibacteria bacterium]|nr:hypothetical protein [Candidatus Latescibacterota bacterium]